MLGIFHLFIHVLIYAGSGILLYGLRTRLYLVPFYVYVGVLQVITSLLNSIYTLDVEWGIQIGGGNICYAAVIWCVALTYIIERDIQTVKMLIIGIVAIQFVFFITYPYYSVLLEQWFVISPMSIPSELFNISFWVFLVGNFLAISEMVIMVFLLEKMRVWVPSLPALSNVAIIYIAILLVDSVIFPLLAFPPTQSIAIIQGITAFYGKLILGILYAVMLITATRILQSRYLTERDNRDVKMAELLSLPKAEVIQAWIRAEDNHEMVKLLLNLLTHDIRNYSNAILMAIELIKESQPTFDERLHNRLLEIRGIELQAIDLVDNIMTLGMVQEQVLRPEEVNARSLFTAALKRIREVNPQTHIEAIGEKVLDTNVRCHPLLQHVFYNLLSNMIKYRKPQHERVIVEINAYTREKQQHVILSDHGVGMTDHEKKRAFDSLRERPRHRGFGLYLVRSILNQLGCEVLIENRQDAPHDYTAGTTFHLIFPIGRP